MMGRDAVETPHDAADGGERRGGCHGDDDDDCDDAGECESDRTVTSDQQEAEQYTQHVTGDNNLLKG